MRIYLLIGWLFFIHSFSVIAQKRTIQGRITSAEDGSVLPGVNVMLKGTMLGTNTDSNGKFTLSVPDQEGNLIVSSIGFTTQEVAFNDQSIQSIIDVQLVAEVKTLAEVAIIGYGEQERKTLTSAISSISAKEIENLPSPSPDQLLQGRASGVWVTSNSGEPGAGILVRVRGITSISANSDPLYIIDGVPVTSGELAQVGAGSSTTNALADVNSSDIESIEVLKDASATAIYGARAANGVVLITTKRGTNSKPVISLGTYYGISQAWKNPNKLRVDGPTFEKLQNEASLNNWVDQYGSIDALDLNGNSYTPRFANPDSALNTNWLDEIFQTAAVRNFDITIRGGNERIKYFLSGSDYLQEGIIRPTIFKRKSGRLNLDFFATNKVKIGTSITYAITHRNRVNNGNSITGAISTAFFYPSNIPIYTKDGSYNKPIWENPVATVKETDFLMQTNRLIGNVFAEYEIIPGLTFRTTLGMDESLVDEYRYFNTKLNAGATINGLGISSITRQRVWINENIISYQLKQHDHNLRVLLGNTIQETSRSVHQASGQQFPGDAFRQLNSAAVKTDASTSTSQYGLVSFFGRINYAFRQKYLATINVRIDASSRFGASNRWGTFPSIALGWVVSEEDFMKEFLSFSNLKLRASYGLTGNQNGIDDFQSLALWGGQRGGLRAGGGTSPINNIGSPAAYVDNPGFTPNQLANPDLKWETTAQLDLGVDIELFKNRFYFTIDYYNKQTTDLLLAVPVPRSIGYNELVQNYGAIQNKGWEVSLNTVLVNREKFNWNIHFNVASNRNKVKKIAASFTAFSRGFIRVEEGYPLFSFWVHEQLGIDPQTGNAIWNTGADDIFDPNADRFIIGNGQPDFFGGFTNTINFRNIDFQCFFQYSYGNDLLNYNRYFFEHGGELTTGYISTQLRRWQKPGDVTAIPRMSKNNYSSDLRPSRLIEDGSYIRLKNIIIGYTFPSNFSKKIFMSKLRVYLSAQNLLTFTRYSGLDPEVSVDANELIGGIDFATMPQPRMMIGGININF